MLLTISAQRSQFLPANSLIITVTMSRSTSHTGKVKSHNGCFFQEETGEQTLSMITASPPVLTEQSSYILRQ